ncbi:MAG: hypothetical protein ACLR8P_02585 [Clostridium fessum]
MAVEVMDGHGGGSGSGSKSLQPQPRLVRQQNRPNRLHRLNQNLSRSYQKRDFRRLERIR